jgi:hypothetical protein
MRITIVKRVLMACGFLGVPALGQVQPSACSSAPFVEFATIQKDLLDAGPAPSDLLTLTEARGDVYVEICVSRLGNVIQSAIIEGAGLLKEIAAGSALRIRFTPGRAFRTMVVFHYIGQGPAPPAAAPVDPRLEQCLGLGSLADEQALSACNSLVQGLKSLKLDFESEARLLGRAARANYFGGRFEESIRLARLSLKSARDRTTQVLADHDWARSAAALGLTKDAVKQYEKTEGLLKGGIGATGGTEKELYTRDLAALRQEFLLFLQKNGQPTDALEKRIKAAK